MPPPQAAVAGRRTQAERRETSRRKILDAAIHCLAEEGYVRATTGRIAQLAGISRGGYLHHFPTRTELLVDAVKHLADTQLASLEKTFDRLPTTERTEETALELMWGSFSGPLYQAALELWVAARTDRDLKAALDVVEPVTGRRMVETFSAFFPPQATAIHDFETRVLLTLNVMRGLAATQIYDPAASTRERHWQRVRPVLVEMFRAPVVRRAVTPPS